LTAVGGNFMGPLRDSEFLSAIKHRSAIPGDLRFRSAGLFLLAESPAEVRSAEFAGWLALIRPLCDSIAELLWLTRQNARANPRSRSAAYSSCNSTARPVPAGAHHLPADTDLFPEISGNQHRCTVRFLNWTDATQPPGARRSRRAVPADLLHLSRAAFARWSPSSNAPPASAPWNGSGVGITGRSAASAAASSISARGSPRNTRSPTPAAAGDEDPRRTAARVLTGRVHEIRACAAPDSPLDPDDRLRMPLAAARPPS
jgi:hypothetical protein